MARHYPPETVKPAENKREAGPKEKKATAPKNDGKKEDAGEYPAPPPLRMEATPWQMNRL